MQLEKLEHHTEDTAQPKRKKRKENLRVTQIYALREISGWVPKGSSMLFPRGTCRTKMTLDVENKEIRRAAPGKS